MEEWAKGVINLMVKGINKWKAKLDQKDQTNN